MIISAFGHFTSDNFKMLITFLYRAMNGILEMEGFQDTLSRLYKNGDDNTTFKLGIFSPSNTSATISDSGTCSSGSSVKSDTLIVRRTIYNYIVHGECN